MKIFPLSVLIGLLTVSSFGQDAKTNAAASTPAVKKAREPIATFQVTNGVITPPFVLTNGAISQPEQTDVPGGGKATFSFTITNAGNYVLKGLVNAPDEDANSFYVNVDAQPEDPMMIWDIEVTTGFEERPVNWRGNGDSGSVEFATKFFKLSAGEHKLFIVGREPSLLKSLSIYPAD